MIGRRSAADSSQGEREKERERDGGWRPCWEEKTTTTTTSPDTSDVIVPGSVSMESVSIFLVEKVKISTNQFHVMEI